MAAALADHLTPRVSLPLAWALERSCAEGTRTNPRSTYHRRAVRALWIYLSLGLTDRVERCRLLAEDFAPEQSEEELKVALAEYKVHDVDFLTSLLSRAEDESSRRPAQRGRA